MKKAQLKTIMLMILFALVGIVSAYAITVSLSYPTNNLWHHSNSVNYSFTPVENTLTFAWCAVYANNTGTMVLKANYSSGLTNGTLHTSGIAIADTIGIGVYTYVNCSNGTTIVNSSFLTYGVDATVPTITLDSPADGTYQSSTTVTLVYTPTDASNLEACILYQNMTGTWHANQTDSDAVSGSANSTSHTGISDGSYIWNVWCNDTATNTAWAEDTNRTLVVDSTSPTAIKIVSPTNNSYSSDQTPLIKWNLTADTNFDKYTVWLSDDAEFSNIVQSKDISTRTENYSTLSNIESDGVYYVRVSAYDLAENVVNVSDDVYYNLDTGTPTVTLNYPTNNTYTSDTTPDFNVTIVDDNPDCCVLYLSQSNATLVKYNMSVCSVTNGSVINLTPQSMGEGYYDFNIGCNDSIGNVVNVSSSLLRVTIDTSTPIQPNLRISWGRTNNTDKTPTLSWFNASGEYYFSRYLAQAFYLDNGTTVYGVNVTAQNTTSVSMILPTGYTYNFSVTAYDMAGNSNTSSNTTDSLYYVDSVCGTLVSGWNLCGAVWTTSRNLSQIGGETSATFVSVWNTSHSWKTCNYAVSAGGTNCDINVSIKNNYANLATPAGITNTTINQSASTLPIGNYTYKISSVSSYGKESIASGNYTLHVDRVDGNISSLSWSAVAGAVSYKIYNTTRGVSFGTFFSTTSTSFNHTGQAVSGAGTPTSSGVSLYPTNNDLHSVWVYVNSSTEWRNRTWVATGTSSNITLTNYSNGWNIEAMFHREGRNFGELGRAYNPANVTMMSMPYPNGTKTSFVNIPSFNVLNNLTAIDYGRGYWVYYNGTYGNALGLYNSTAIFNVGSW